MAHWVDRGTGWWLFSGQLETHQVAGGDVLWTVKDSPVDKVPQDLPDRQRYWLLLLFSAQLKTHQADRGIGCWSRCSLDN